jgi:Mlc titration factor MtfA (ptsG expression regulator)
MFIAKFPAIALFVDFEDFAKMVDSALEELQELIDKNENIQAILDVKGDENNDGI